jgi:hypothetical protein
MFAVETSWHDLHNTGHAANVVKLGLPSPVSNLGLL